MGELKRNQLQTRFNEASALVPSGRDNEWWLASDEADLSSMISRLTRDDTTWSLTPLPLHTRTDTGGVTDAEALASYGDFTFVFGSGFTGPRGTLDRRRSFVARFQNTAAARNTAAVKDAAAGRDAEHGIEAEVLDLGPLLVRKINHALAVAGIVPLPAKRKAQRTFRRSLGSHRHANKTTTPINIEGAAMVGDDLVLGLRWPVSHDGQPIIVTLLGASRALTADAWTADEVMACASMALRIQAGGTPKRPTGVRALSVAPDGSVHAILGPTERNLAPGKTKAAGFVHVALDLHAATTTELESFRGYRKVEALAPLGDRWIYALDDEDAVVLLTPE